MAELILKKTCKEISNKIRFKIKLKPPVTRELSKQYFGTFGKKEKLKC